MYIYALLTLDVTLDYQLQIDVVSYIEGDEDGERERNHWNF